jgi:hypothetical protein
MRRIKPLKAIKATFSIPHPVDGIKTDNPNIGWKSAHNSNRTMGLRNHFGRD